MSAKSEPSKNIKDHMIMWRGLYNGRSVSYTGLKGRKCGVNMYQKVLWKMIKCSLSDLNPDHHIKLMEGNRPKYFASGKQKLSK